MLIIGLTGGIATGKSTVSNRLREVYHFPIIDADVIARTVVEPGKPAYNKIVDYFGGITPNLVNDDGTAELNRAALGRVVFANDKHRKVLNSIVHPAVRKAIAWSVISHWLRGYKTVVLDVPLLFESQLDSYTGLNVAVLCDEDTQLQRLRSRDQGLTEAEARDRIASQMPLATKREKADIVIDNNGSLTDLYGEIDRFAKSKYTNPSIFITLLQWLPPVGLLWAFYVHWSRTHRSSSGSERKPLLSSNL